MRIFKAILISSVLIVSMPHLFSQTTHEVRLPVAFDVSIPLRDMPNRPNNGAYKTWRSGVVLNKMDIKKVIDPVSDAIYPERQAVEGPRAGLAPLQNFEGLANSDNASRVTPPDSDGDVGPNHYVQSVNGMFRIMSKTGSVLYGPVTNSTIWSGFSGAWDGHNDGDPIVLYDEVADRWLTSQFAIDCGASGQMYELIAISQTGDPTGAWYRYAYEFDYMPDYPHFGIWADGYYMAINRFNYSTSAFIGAGAVVFERDQMLAGNAGARMVFFNTETLSGGGPDCYSMLPADCDGTFAPTGTSCPFVYMNDNAWGGNDELRVWLFHTDWTNTANCTFTYQGAIAVASFDAAFTTDIPQPGTIKLNTLSDRLMYRLQYRNFGTHQAMVTNHSVEVAVSQAGVRWYELRPTSGVWGLYQQGTFAPDAHSRWMASIAMNTSGAIGLGYTVSSSTLNPAIRYTGRLATDALGTMTFAEQTIQQSTTSMTDYARWGDYSMLSVDPADGLTFWHTNEYVGSYGGWCPWSTRIASFKFASTPSVVTTAATSVTGTTATLNGTINPSGFSSTYYFEYGTTTAYGYTTSSQSAGSASTTFPVSAAITGLTAGSPYHFRLVGVNSEGTAYGNDMTFTPGAAAVTTAAITSVTGTSAVSGGNVTTDGGSPVTARGVCWGTSLNPVSTGLHTTDGAGTGSFVSNITGLSANTTYHVRAYATNSGGTYYGDDLTFTTPCATYTLPFSESFATASWPTCWSQQVSSGLINSWSVAATANAGGAASEMRSSYQTGTGTTRLVLPAINTVGQGLLNLSFRHYVDAYSTGTTIKVESSTDGVNWTSEAWSVSLTATNIAATLVNTSVASNLNSTTTYIAFTVTGNLYNYDYWYIDNVQVTTANTLAVSPSSQNVTYAAGSTAFAVTSNTMWSVASDASWCTPTLSGTGNGTIAASCSANSTTFPRTANLTVTAASVSPIVVTVVQAATPSNLTVSPALQNVTAYPGATSFSITSTLPWNASSDAAWCTVTPSGTGNGTLLATCTQNTGITQRTANLNITTSSQTVAVQVIQSAAPLVLTYTTSWVTSSFAFAGGDVISDGGSAVTERGVCWSTSPNPTVADNTTSDGAGTGAYTSQMAPLIPGQTYYFRAYAINGIENLYGTEYSFTTLSTPVVTTSAISGITTSGASCGGVVTDEGTSPTTERGVCWNTTGNPTIADDHTSDGSGAGAFTSTITGLPSGTTFYVKAYATNSSGTSYGDQISFTTIAVLSMTELVVPRYIGGKTSSTLNNARTPFAVCVKFEGLTPLTSYDYKAGIELVTGAATSYGGGNIWNGTEFSNTNFSNAFVTNAQGASGPVWIIYQPTGNSTRFGPGQQHTIRISVFPTGGSAPGTAQWAGTKTITCLDIATTAMTSETTDDGAYIKGTADPSVTGKYVLLFDNENGTGDPLYSFQIRQTNSTQISNTQLNTEINDIYMQAGTSIVGNYPAVVPIGANNPNGIRRVEARSAANITTGYNTDADGIWPTNTTTGNTTDPTRLAIRYIGITDAPLTAAPSLITTTAVTSIAATTALSGGTATVVGGQPITARGVCWSQTPAPTLANEYTEDGTGGGVFTSTLTDLVPYTTYYVRAYATNSTATAYGNEYMFTTLGAVVLTTTSPGDITSSSALSGGNITSDGGSAITARGVCWSTASSPTIAGNHTTDGAGTGSFSSTLSGLSPNTPYYVRAYATNAGGTTYGGEETFTTLCEPVTLPFSESFDGPVMPDCWTTQTIGTGAIDKWTVQPTTYAGGTANEIRSAYQVVDPGTTRLVMPAFNTTGLNQLNLSFKHMVNAYSTGVALKIQSSTDGIIWTDEAWFVNLTSTNIEATTVNTTILNNLNAPATFVAFTITGDLYNYDYWNIDDVVVTGQENMLFVTPPTANLGFSGGTVDFAITTNTNWSASSDATWCNIPASGTGNGTLTANCDPNTTSVARTATITVEVAGVDPVAVTLVQAANGSTLVVTPPLQDVWSYAGSFDFAVSTISPWTATSTATWCQVTPSGTGNGSLTASFGQNTSTLAREALITVTVEGIDPVTVALTQQGGISITTAIPSNLDFTTATGGGTITGDGGDPITARGICWSIYTNPFTTDSHTIDGDGTGTFSSAMTDLSAGTTYHVRAYATNSHETVYGSDLQFSTLCNTQSLPYSESFGNSSFPACWSQQGEGTGILNRWSVTNSNYAGGTAYEMRSMYQGVNPGTTRLVTPALNTTGYAQLNLSFKHMLNAYGTGATLKIQSSTDGINWTDEAWTVATTATDIPASTVSTTILNNLNNATTYVAFVVTGDLFEYDYWYIDDVLISGVCSEPATQASNISVTGPTASSLNLSWTRGSGDGVIVVAHENTVPVSYPVNGTNYPGNGAFGAGSPTGANSFVVYNGTGTNCTVTNLASGMMYYFEIYEYTGTSFCYKLPPSSGMGNTFCVNITDYPYTEDFENDGQIPWCWTQFYNTGSLLWTCATGGYGSLPPTAHSGTYNARLYEGAYGTPNVTKLISPAFDLTNRINNTLTFWHAQALWTPDQDELRVYYRTSATGTWNLLATYTEDVSVWTQRTIALPNPSANYYIAFEGTENYGHGVVIDDVVIDGTAVTLGVAPSSQSVSAAAGSAIFSVTTTATWTAVSDAAWCTVTAGGTGNGNLTASFTENTSIYSRSANITVNVPGLTPVVVTLTQAAGNPSLSISPPNRNVANGSGTTTFTVSSNSPWTVSSNASWCVPTASGSGNGTIIATYEANPLFTSRVATLTVTVSGLLPVNITVTQAAGIPALNVSPPQQNVAATAGTVPFTVTSNTAWIADSDASWCTVTHAGNGNGTITATFNENLSTLPRTANITVSANGATPVIVTVVQAGVDPILTVTPPSQSVGAGSGATGFEVTSNLGWTTDSDALWCSVTNGQTGNGTITATFNENLSILPRTANITVSANGATPVIVTVVQAGADPILTVMPPSQSVGAGSGATSFEVTSNTGWFTDSDAAWCSVTTGQTGNGTITATFNENLSTLPRTANITVSASGATPVIVTVVQAGADPILTVAPPSQSVGAGSGATGFEVTSNLGWTTESDALWCSVTNGQTGNGTITATFNENLSTLSRTANITVSASGATPVIVTVVQAGADPILTVTPPSQSVGAGSGATGFEVTSNTGWFTESDAAWCSVTNGQTGNGTITATFNDNLSILPRTANITVSANGATPVFVTVVQAGADPILTVTPPLQSVGAGSGSTGFEVTSNTGWFTESDALWCSVTNGQTGNGTITATFNENLSTLPRTANITVSANGATPLIVTVVQAGVDPILTVTPPSQSVGAGSGATGFEVTSNLGWTTDSDALWCSVTNGQTGNGTITATFNENLSTLPRTANITVSASGATPVIVTVVQAASTVRTITLKVFPEGLFNGTNLNKARNETGDQFSGDIADVVDIEFRTPEFPYAAAATITDVTLTTDGIASADVPAEVTGNHYLVVKHRNSLTTWSALPVALDQATISYDFTTDLSQAYGNNLKPLAPGVFGFFAGDVNGDGQVNAADIDAIHADAALFNKGYLSTDVNGDGAVDALDLIVTDNNAATSATAILP